jgi:mutator protein MutT
MIEVVCGIIERNDKILIAKRKNDHWEFPGGKINENETPEDALSRELQEELMIDTDPLEHIFINEVKFVRGEKRIHLMAFHVTDFKGDITPTVHENIAWIEPSEAPDYELIEGDMRLLEFYKEYCA